MQEQPNSVPVSTAHRDGAVGVMRVKPYCSHTSSGVLGPCKARVELLLQHTFKHRQQVACAGGVLLAAIIISKHMLFIVTFQLITLIITKLRPAAYDL